MSPEVKKMVRELPDETLKVVDLIPGLEDIREILQRVDIQPKFEVEDGTGIRTAASILRVALDYDYYHEQGHEDGLILRTLKSRADSYDEKVVDTLSQILDTDADNYSLQEIDTRDLSEGMRLNEELLLDGSMLIASAGADVDRTLLKIIRNYISCYSAFPFPKKIQVMIPVA